MWLLDLGYGILVDQRALLHAGLEPVATFNALEAATQLFHKGVVDARLQR